MIERSFWRQRIESAYVDELCEIGEGAKIGRKCSFGQNCHVANES